MKKFRIEIESTFCVEDINNLSTLLNMFEQTAELEGKDRKTKKYRVVVEEI